MHSTQRRLPQTADSWPLCSSCSVSPPPPIRSLTPIRSMPRPPPVVMEELVEAILLRFPPEEPALLFRRRFRELHPTAPMLGFFHRAGATITFIGHRDFIHNSSFRLPHAIVPTWRSVDALHGRILFHDTDIAMSQPTKKGLVVFNPITGEVWRLPMLQLYMYRWSAALLCTAAGCDYLDCGGSGGPFLVAFVGKTTFDGFILACVYSSEQGAWSEPSSVQHHSVCGMRGPGVLVENALYFVCEPSTGILEYDLGEQGLWFISLPSACKDRLILLMTAEDGGLGFATIVGYKLYIWSREAGLDGDNGWSQQRVVDLDNLPPVHALSFRSEFFSVAAGVGVIFIGTHHGIFAIDLKSVRLRKIFNGYACHARGIVPYMSFCTPALGLYG